MEKVKVNEVNELGIVTGSECFNGGKGVPRACKSVAIVGFATSSMKDVQYLFGDQNIEIWPLNQLYMAFPEIVPANRPPEKRNHTRWFQIHHRHSYDQTVNRSHSHHDWMAQQRDFPIYMQKKESDIPMSMAFPKDELLKKFNRKYFTNSISWMLALAIYEQFENIYLFGVDMAQDSEYAFERPSVEYFLGMIDNPFNNQKLILPEKSDLLKTAWLYPFEEDSVIRTKIDSRRRELRERANHLRMQEQQAHDNIMQLHGALDNMNYVERAWMSSVKDQMGPKPE